MRLADVSMEFVFMKVPARTFKVIRLGLSLSLQLTSTSKSTQLSRRLEYVVILFILKQI